LLFNKETYAELYELNKNDDLLNHWLNNGIKERQICYDFTVPDAFNAEDYIAKQNIKNNNKFAYLHWIINSKDNLYFDFLLNTDHLIENDNYLENSFVQIKIY
jgi:hypothetical protein